MLIENGGFMLAYIQSLADDWAQKRYKMPFAELSLLQQYRAWHEATQLITKNHEMGVATAITTPPKPVEVARAPPKDPRSPKSIFREPVDYCAGCGEYKRIADEGSWRLCQDCIDRALREDRANLVVLALLEDVLLELGNIAVCSKCGSVYQSMVTLCPKCDEQTMSATELGATAQKAWDELFNSGAYKKEQAAKQQVERICVKCLSRHGHDVRQCPQCGEPTFEPSKIKGNTKGTRAFRRHYG